MIWILLACSDSSITSKNVNATPEATIILPDSTGGGDVEDGIAVLFRAVVTDADPDDQAALQARWRVDSNAEPACDYAAPDENGETSCDIFIEAGMQKVIVEVRDSQNDIGTDEYILNVIETEPPEIFIDNPVEDGEYSASIPIDFMAVVSDEEDSYEELNIAWESDISGALNLEGEIVEGQLSSTGEFSSQAVLPEGLHLITATVTDSNGKTANDSVEITVGPAIEAAVDIVSLDGISVDTVSDGQTVLCTATSEHPENDSFTWTYQWFHTDGTDITALGVDVTQSPQGEQFTIDFASQNFYPTTAITEEMLTCTAVSDGPAIAGADEVPVVQCDPFAEEIPHDGIDSNCDGLETLNDQDGDGIPDSDEDFDADDDYPDLHNGSTPQNYDIPPRVGVECYGKSMTSDGQLVYFLLCDNDEYWKDANAFCQDNGYDSLATFHSTDEMDHAKTLIDGFLNPDGSRMTDAAMIGYTRGPDCLTSTGGTSPYPSVCGSNISNYYWIDDPQGTDWVQSSHWADPMLSGSVEHCGQLISNANHYGFWDVYCEYGAGTHWSKTYTNSRAVMCMKRQ